VLPCGLHIAKPRGREAGHLALIAIVILAVAGCSSPPSPSPSPGSPTPPPSVAGSPPGASPSPGEPGSAAYPLRLFDDEGTMTIIQEAPGRIVSLTPAATETLFALGVGDLIVATSDSTDYPPQAVALPDVATFTSVDVEKIIDLDPDVVIAGGNNFNPPEAIVQLRSLNVPVLVLYAPTVEAVLSDIEFIGRAVNKARQASDMTAAMRAGFDQVSRATQGLPRPRVFYELDATNGIFGPADDSFIEEMITLAGGDPVTTGSPTAFEISLEKLVAADPEIIVLGDAAYGVTPDIVSARPGWGGMTAVRKRAIRPVNDIVVTRPGPRLVDGLRELALAIHPDAPIDPPASLAPGGSPVPVGSSIPVASPASSASG
jgi:iron complex transport system substrate-binding protein